jgi:hypothetical protein
LTVHGIQSKLLSVFLSLISNPQKPCYVHNGLSLPDHSPWCLLHTSQMHSVLSEARKCSKTIIPLIVLGLVCCCVASLSLRSFGVVVVDVEVAQFLSSGSPHCYMVCSLRVRSPGVSSDGCAALVTLVPSLLPRLLPSPASGACYQACQLPNYCTELHEPATCYRACCDLPTPASQIHVSSSSSTSWIVCSPLLRKTHDRCPGQPNSAHRSSAGAHRAVSCSSCNLCLQGW